MKKRFLTLLAVAVAVTFWVNNSGPGSDAIRAAWRGLTLPFRAARLMLEPPDRQLLMPVQGVNVRRVVNTWHASRGGSRLHEGQDIFARRGTPVLSATDGIIVRVGEDRLGGRAVSVLGAGARTYYYAHLDRYSVNEHAGEEIAHGAVIGYVGNTGNARTTPPHLHFGIYTPSGAIDPLPLLSQERVSNT